MEFSFFFFLLEKFIGRKQISQELGDYKTGKCMVIPERRPKKYCCAEIFLFSYIIRDMFYLIFTVLDTFFFKIFFVRVLCFLLEMVKSGLLVVLEFCANIIFPLFSLAIHSFQMEVGILDKFPHGIISKSSSGSQKGCRLLENC